MGSRPSGRRASGGRTQSSTSNSNGHGAGRTSAAPAAAEQRAQRRPPSPVAAASACALALLLLALAAAPRRVLAQFDDTSNFNFNAPGSASSASAVRNAIQPLVTAGNIQLVSTGQPPVTWSLSKTADQSSVRVQAGAGASAAVNYLVRVTANGPTNQQALPFQVTGNIIINNPNNGLSVRFRQVTANLQMFAGPTLGSWANGFTGGPMTFPAVCNSFTVPPNGNIICTFSAPVAFAGTGQVTPVAVFTDDYIVQAAGGTGNVQGIPVPISVPGGLSAPPCATVSDAFAGPRPPTQVTGDRPTGASVCDTKSFSYRAAFGPYKTTECGTFTVTNTATVAPSGGSSGQPQTQSASVNVEVFGCDAAAAPAAAAAPPPAPAAAGFVPGTTTSTFGDQPQQPQPFAQPFAQLFQVAGMYSGGAAAAAAAPSQPGGWTVTTTQNPPATVSLRANGLDTAAVAFTVAAAPVAAAAPAAAAAGAAPAQAFASGVVNVVNPVGQAFAVQLVSVEVSNSVVLVGTGTASCPAAVLPAATAAGPGLLACPFSVPVASGAPGVVTARVLMPQLAQAVVSPAAAFTFAAPPPAAGAASSSSSSSSATARATVDSTFAPAGFAYAPMSISGSGARPATAPEGGTFLTGPQTWSWALTLGPFPSGKFCGSNTMTTVARVFPLTPGGQVDPSQQVGQSGVTLTVLVDCAGQGAATETYTPTGERRRRKLLMLGGGGGGV
jgi:hypothetical protein